METYLFCLCPVGFCKAGQREEKPLQGFYLIQQDYLALVDGGGVSL